MTDDSVTPLRCSAEGCEELATETVFLRGQVGHVHDCARHTHDLREWCDVIHGEPIVGGECMAVVCTVEGIWFGPPRPLGDAS